MTISEIFTRVDSTIRRSSVLVTAITPTNPVVPSRTTFDQLIRNIDLMIKDLETAKVSVEKRKNKLYPV